MATAGNMVAMIEHPELTALLTYDPDTGVFHWREPKYPRRPDGVVGFRNDEGYLKTKIRGRTYALHRLAWFYVHGEWPTDQVDHINGKRDDNRMENLRQASQGENRANSKTNHNNALGVRGVRKKQRGTGYEARIRKDGKLISIGYFATIQEAKAAYQAAQRILHGEFASKR